MSCVHKVIPRSFFLLIAVMCLSSCAEMPRQNKTPQSGNIARLFYLYITIPPHWQIPSTPQPGATGQQEDESRNHQAGTGSGIHIKEVPSKIAQTGQQEGTSRNQIILVEQGKKAKVVISSKTIVSPPHSTSAQDLIRAYGRIGIKQILKEEGGRQNKFTDNLTIAGQAAVQYVIEQGDKDEGISFVQFKDKLFIIRTTAPREELKVINEFIMKNIHFGNTSVDHSVKIHRIDYEISPHIAGLHFGDLQVHKINFDQDGGRGKNISAQIEALEQICFVNALLRSEGLNIINDHAFLQTVMNSVKKIYVKNKTVLPVARCYGLVLFLKKDFNQSSLLFNRIIQDYPDDPYAKLYLVMIRPYSFGDTHVMLENILADSPGNVLALYLQAKMLLAQGKEREGIDRLKKMLRRHPENIWLNYIFARNASEDNSMKQEKIKLKYIKILEEVPSFAGARFNLALSLFKEKQYDKSLEHLNIILARYPDDVAAYILKGLIYKTQNKYLLAKKQFEFALSLEPGNFKALYNLGALCAANLQDTVCARQAFIQYLHVAPKNDKNAAVTSWLHEN